MRFHASASRTNNAHTRSAAAANQRAVANVLKPVTIANRFGAATNIRHLLRFQQAPQMEDVTSKRTMFVSNEHANARASKVREIAAILLAAFPPHLAGSGSFEAPLP
jgi:hypothetical protein